MFKSITNALGAARDRAFEAAAKSFVARKIQNFGHINQLQIDTKDKKISVEVVLKGEVSPIQLWVESYDVLRKEGETFIRIHKVNASREWMGIALNEYVIGQEIKVPSAVGGML